MGRETREAGDILEQRGTGGAQVTLTGNRVAEIDGCDGIVDYGEEEVLLRAGRLMVRIKGRHLQLKRLTENSAVVHGLIQGLDYEY